MMKNFYRLLMIMLVGLAIAGCSSSKFESDFKQGCRDIGGTRSFCTCSFEKVENHYGKDTVIAVSRGKQQIPEDWMIVIEKSGMACRKEL